MNRFRKISYAWLWPLLFLNASCDKPNDQPSVVKPEVTIEDQNGLEKNEDFIALISIKLSKPATTNVVLRYSTKDITARSGQDYIGVTDVLSIIPAGQSGVLVPVTIIGDKVKEPDETFELVITQALNATIVKQRALITIINDDADSNIIEVPTEGYVSPGEYPGYQLVWSDEFRQPTIDKSNWTFEIGNGSNGWGNNELQYYKEENASIYAEEYLMITAKEESVGGFDYTSSRMITKGKREFKFGRVDIRAAMPIGQGIWPALWSLGADIQT
ncbi:MAG TPA: Calx-beta domain-containing protein, partial [Saprospiraceae bacterium]|nr:Calx-beta domain-containing protein [Saprospiraceae bacterium]